MTETQNVNPQQQSKQGRVWRSLLFMFLVFVVFVIVAVGCLMGTNSGSQFLLNRVVAQQKTIQFQYGRGNLLQGIEIKNLAIRLKKTDILADSAEVTLGWRALLSREVHLNQADIKNLKIVNKGPSSNKPFAFNPIKLPIVLRINHATLDHLLIQNPNSQVHFYNIELNDALWADDALRFRQSAMNMGYLDLKNADCEIKLSGKYPLTATGDVVLPSLQALNIRTIKVHATGTLDTLHAGIATQTPDLLTGWVNVRPLQPAVPMQGELNVKQYNWPIALQQQLYTESGLASFAGNIRRLDLSLQADLKGKEIPQGVYSAKMHTDLVHQLNIERFNGQLMDGEINLDGQVGWHKQLSWQIQGRTQNLNRAHNSVPSAIRDFLPSNLNAAFSSKGQRNSAFNAAAQVKFDQFETWNLTLKQRIAKKPQPLFVNVAWLNFDRSLPYVGWFKSPQGDVALTLQPNQQAIQLKTSIAANENSQLPAGTYSASVRRNGSVVNISSVKLQTTQGDLVGQAKVVLPQAQKPLLWSAQLQAKAFNPQQINTSLPFNLFNGQLTANGRVKKNQQIIQINNIALKGRMAQQMPQPWVALTGKSTAVLLFKPTAPGGLQSYAVRYDGQLSAAQSGQGPLTLRLTGTPSYLKIEKFQHAGAAGKIDAKGWLAFKQNLMWNIQASLKRFKPQYFLANQQGDISGVVQTNGVWSERIKQVNIQQLNLAGYLNQKVIRGTGNLSLTLNQRNGALFPQQFQANRLMLAYGSNQLQASGNAQNLNVRVNAPDLSIISPQLMGRIYGDVDLQTQPTLQVMANILVDNLAYANQYKLKKLRIQGQLPTSNPVPRILTAQLSQFSYGQRQIDQANIRLAGTRQAQVLDINAENQRSKFELQVAGGFRAGQWLGLLQKGKFDSKRILLQQQQATVLRYNTQDKSVLLGAHCWLAATTTRLCLDRPLKASASQGNVSVTTQDLQLGDFAAFMPEGLAITGKLNGYAKAAWQKGRVPQLDLQLDTQKGELGLASENPDDPATTLQYDQLRLIARSVPQGILTRFDVKTPSIGTGYAKLLIQPQQTPMPMSGEVALDDVQLKIFKPFIADVRNLDGRLALAGKINGTLTKPEFTGNMRLKDGAISMISLPVNLNNIQLYSAIRQNNASIDGAFNSGRGAGTLTGQIDWQNDPLIQLKLKGDKLLLRQAPMIRAQVTPDLSLELRPKTKKLSLSGTVDVPRALISMPESTKPMVNVSSDVRVIRRGQENLAIVRAAQPWDIRADIAVNLGDQVIFQGFNSRIPLLGRLNLTQRGLETALRANGAIGVSQKVKIEAYGQSLDLNRAIARFNGPVSNPSLDIDATKSVQGSVVGVRVTGTAAVPNIQIYNDAGLSEQEALNALVTGRLNEGGNSLSNTAGFKSEVNTTIAAAGISLGLGGTRALTNQIGKSFGLNGLAFDAQGEGDDTQVSLTGYLTPDLYIRYGVGVFTPVNKLTLRYQMNKRLYLEASQSLERAIDVFYNWRF